MSGALPSHCYVDVPAVSTRVYAECISVAGWVYVPGREPSSCRVRGWIEGELIGETSLVFVRPDVCAAMKLPPTIATGFRFIGRFSGRNGAARDAELIITVSWPDEAMEYEAARVTLHLFPAHLKQRPYGDHIHPEQSTVLHREQIYGSGPPIENPGAETLYLIQQYLAPRSSVLDIGCGAGAYGPALIADGHEWLGLEVNQQCLEILTRRGLPHRNVTEPTGALPVGDREFQSAVCIEVLEHIAEPEAFLAEIARSVVKRALFSVPNIEVIPYFSALQVVPWHLLEADHKNFFTRASLRELLRKYFARVEVFTYAEHPLRTPDGIPLHLHLFAIADKA